MTALPDDLERLLAEEPFVRRLAQHLVAGEAEDVVQQTWLRVLQTRPGLLQKPRQWLASVVRHLAMDHRRGERRRGERERVASPAAVPSPSEMLAVEESRRTLVAAVNTLPEAMRSVVLLRFYEGLPPRRIAARLGTTPSAVSNRLHDALHELRRRLRERDRDSRAWLAALTPLANAPCKLPWRELAAPAAAAGVGVISMTTKTKIVASLAVVLVLASAIVAWPTAPDSATEPTRAAEPVAPATAALEARVPEPVQPTAEVPQRDPVHAPPANIATTGSLVVRVRYADEPSIASGVTVCVYWWDEWTRASTPCAVTDDTGTARFHELRPGRVTVNTAAQPWTGKYPTIAAGTESECLLELAGGMTLTGIVVDPLGVPVGGAILEATRPRFGTTISSPGVTAADGTFSLRQCAKECLIGARAPGFAASKLYLVQGRAGSTQHVRIELLPNGGNVAGRVVGPDGSPVASAIVRVGHGRTEALPESAHGTESVPAQVATDTDGRFLAVGVPAGGQPVQVQAAGLAPWRGTTDVVAASTVQVAVSLAQGYTCSGFVTDENGRPLAGVRVQLAREKDESFARVNGTSNADGSFTVAGIPAGLATLSAAHRDHGSGSVQVNGVAGQVIACDMVLWQGIVLRGRVVDDLGAPVAKVEISFAASGAPRWHQIVFTDAEGRFAANNCPPDRPLAARITTKQHVPLMQRGIDPRAGQVELKLMRDTAPRGRIVGRVLLGDGKPAAGETVEAYCADVLREAEERAVGPDGSFEVEVPAGTWTLGVAANAHAAFRSEQRRLEPGSKWDLGTIRLDRGGTVRVSDGSPALSYRIITPDGEHAADLAPVQPQRSRLLNAGGYLLLVRGENVAAQAIPFTIRSGEETVVDVKHVAGVRQRFTFVLAEASKRISSLEVRANGRLVTMRGDGFDTVWLAPGSYTLHVRSGDATTTVPFTVAAQEGPPVRVELH